MKRMMIWKYEFEVKDEVQVREIPIHAQTLSVQVQDGLICVWMRVDPQMDRRKRYFRVYGTGQQIDEDATYFGTVQMRPFVWHLFLVDESGRS